MASNQRRTDDLRRLKTRALIYQYPNGTYPGQGSVPYITDTTGTMGWSPVTVDASGNEYVPGNLIVDLSGHFGGNLDVSGNIRGHKNLYIDLSGSFGGNVDVGGNLVVDLSGSFGGNVDVGGNLVVDLSGSFGGNVDVGGNLVVDLSGSFGGNVDVSGSAFVHRDLVVDLSANIGGNLDVSGDATIHGSTALEGNLDVSGDITAAKLTIVGNPSEIDLQTTDTQMRLYAQKRTTGVSEGTIGIADLSGVWQAPTVTFDVSQSMIHIDPQLSNSENLPIMTLDNSGNVTVNGNITVNSTDPGIYNTGSMQAAYITLPDLAQGSTEESYLYEQGNTLLWENNQGVPERISGWNSILDPSGTIALLALSANLTDVINTVNQLLTLISSRNAFFYLTIPPQPQIQFQTDISATISLVGGTPYTLTRPITTINLDDLITGFNTSLTGSTFKFTVVNNTVIFTNSSSTNYQIRDAVPGSAYNLFNHLNILLPPTYNVASLSLAQNGSTIALPPAVLGSSPLKTNITDTPVITVQPNTTQTAVTITWTCTIVNATAFAVAQNGVTKTIIPVGATYTYTFTNLSVGPTYALSVTPLSHFDAGTAVTKNVTLTSKTVNMFNSGYFTAVPPSPTPVGNATVLSGTLATGIWTDPLYLSDLRYVLQIQNITMTYTCSSTVAVNGTPNGLRGVCFVHPTRTIFYSLIGNTLAGSVFGNYLYGSPNSVQNETIIPTPSPGAATFSTLGGIGSVLYCSTDANPVIYINQAMQYYWRNNSTTTGWVIYNFSISSFAVTYVGVVVT